jgi:hypothetical protein
MTYLTSTCLYCINGRQITADKSQWLMHLSGHREEIIKNLSNTSSSCIFCICPERFANKEHAAAHYRWAHKKNTLVDWSFHKLPTMVLAQ